MTSCRILFVAVIFLVSLQIALGGIECYHCSSDRSGECGDGFNPSQIPQRFCSSYGALCSKRIVKAEVEMVIRGCVTRPEICYEPEFLYCSTCDANGCNLSWNILPSFTVMITAISFVIVKHYL